MNRLTQCALGIIIGLVVTLFLGEGNLKLSLALGVAFILIGVAMLLKNRKRNGIIGVAIIPALLSLPAGTRAAEPEQPIRPAGAVVVGVGLGLLIGCGYVCYRTIDQCEKNKKKIPPPPPPRNPNTETNGTSLWLSAASGGEEDCDSYSGYYNYLSDYCSVEADGLAVSESEAKFHGVTITIVMGYDGIARVDGIRTHSGSELISHEEEKAALQRYYGINWSTHGGSYQATKNGQPTDRESVPFTINQSPIDPKVTIYPDRPQHEFHIDMSTDGITYNRMAHISMPSGQRLLFQDVRDSQQAFYRVTSL